jgi:hypothetical protein
MLSRGPGMTVAKGTTRVDIADLFYAGRWQPVFAAPGVYRLRVCIPFEGHGVVKSEPIRIEVADIPAEERQFIEQDRDAFASAVYGTPIVSNDLNGMYKIEGRLSRCENRSLLRCNIQILEQFRKSDFRVNDACKRFFTRLRQERGDIVADLCILHRAEDFYNRKQWRDAEELLSLMTDHSAQKEVLWNQIQGRGR